MDSLVRNDQGDVIKGTMINNLQEITQSIQNSQGIYGEEKIQYIFHNLRHLTFGGDQMIASGFGHAVRSIISLSEIWIALGGKKELIESGIRTLVFTMAMTCMQDFSKASISLKISKTLNQESLESVPLRKIPYQKEYFCIENGKLIIQNGMIKDSIAPNSGKCPAVGVYIQNDDLLLQKKKQLITFLIDEIAKSYLTTTS